ncbi:hypothetical protein VTO42DRAFT_1549 [Malbranchea cinnamomea]
MGSSSIVPEADLRTFTEHLKRSRRILALLGAGLSAASGLPTFRGAGGLWRRHGAIDLASEEAFMAHPDLVWQFYSYRRHMALLAKPNKAHYALAELAKRNRNFITLTQNVDGLSQRAGHPKSQLYELHGSLFTVKCTGLFCRHVAENEFTDPIVPALALPRAGTQPEPVEDDKTGEKAAELLTQALNSSAPVLSKPLLNPGELDISDPNVPLPKIPQEELPRCPKCEGLLRPGVVWFGEALPEDVLETVDKWIEQPETIDLILVVGTSAAVFPAALYIDTARGKGAKVAVINMDKSHMPRSGLKPGDWFFEGDASAILPEILKPAIGEI